MAFKNGIGYPKMADAYYPIMDDAMEVCTKVYLPFGHRIGLLLSGRIVVVALVRGDVPVPKKLQSSSIAAVVAPEWITQHIDDKWKT